MKFNNLLISNLLFLFFIYSQLSAQESVNATGGNIISSSGSMSYSIGQLVNQQISGSSVSLTQGVQQPYEISQITALETSGGIDLTVSAFPNPTFGSLNLMIEELALSEFQYQLYNLSGVLLQNKKITEPSSIIFMGDLPPSIYYVRIIKRGSEVKTFKIIKN